MKIIKNQETQKIELHFDKSEYNAMSNAQKGDLKSAYLWSRCAGAWVSRSTQNHYWALQTAKKLGFDVSNIEKTGERLSYAEEVERKAEKAESRAERFETYSENAETRAKHLQSALESYRGDIAFFTQPIIAGHAGSRAFANYRERLYKRYEMGFEEYQKSEYYQDRAATARATASMAQLKNRVYLHNRIKECNKNLLDMQKTIVQIEENIYKLERGEKLEYSYEHNNTVEKNESWLERVLEKYEYEHGKLEFFEKALADLGGIQYSQDNIKPGFIVSVKNSGRRCEIISAGPVNVTYKILDGGAAGMVLTDPYAAILEIIQAKEKTSKVINPFSVGDILCKHRPGDDSIYQAYQVVKVTGTGVKIQQIALENGEPVPDRFISEPMQKKVTKSKWSEWVGVYDDDWQLQKYSHKGVMSNV